MRFIEDIKKFITRKPLEEDNCFNNSNLMTIVIKNDLDSVSERSPISMISTPGS
jgi:hypothetical protein